MSLDGSEIIGIDEVGRGCLAGPLLVVAARSRGKLPNGLADSKQLSAKRRQELYQMLIPVCDFGEGWVSVAEINKAGLSGAMRLGVKRALDNLRATASDTIVIDGRINYCPTRYERAKAIIKADASVPIVSAASIYAKVTRDTYMQKISLDFPAYGFSDHVGYGTKAHLQALAEYGVITELHRINFAPIKSLLAVAQ